MRARNAVSGQCGRALAIVLVGSAIAACGSESAVEARVAPDAAGSETDGPEVDGTDASTEPVDDAGASDAPDPGCDDCADGGAPDTGDVTDATPDSADAGDAGDASVGEPDAAPSDAGPVGPFRVYMAVTGDDASDGLSPAKAVRTLGRVHAIVAAAKPARDVEVRIGPGTYYADSVVWTYTMKDHDITLMPADGGKDRPVFDGCASATGACAARTWFTLSASSGRATNVHIRYVRVQRYSTAISFNGNRDDFAGRWNGYNEIFGCWFERIGNGYAPSLPYSTAVVRLVNSDHNRIVNNHFVDGINTYNGGAIHDIYAAHGSSDNTIANNRFQRSTGDPVRFRDFSNRNDVTGNRFVRVGTGGGYSDWYCDHDTRTDCTKTGPECPSWDNEFRDNVLDGTWTCGKLPTFVYYQDATATGCSKPTATSVRLQTSGNTHTTTPCTGDGP